MRLISLFLLAISFSVSASELTVSAAASLQDVMAKMAKEFERESSDIKVFLNFASSGKLRAQIEKGAPVDLFMSASSKHMDILQNQKLILNESRTNFASNKLVLISPRSNSLITNISSLTGDDVKRICIGTPTSVPVGRYAKEALESFNLWNNVKSRLIYGSHARQVLDYVARNEVDAGLVYTTDAKKRSDKIRIVESIEDKHYTQIVYPLAILRSSKNKVAANSFVKFVKSRVGQAILSEFGFGNGK